MGEKINPGLEAVKTIYKLWMVEDSRAVWGEHGFEWWPGDFRVQVTWEPEAVDEEPKLHKITVRTEVLRDVPAHDPSFWKSLTIATRHATTYLVATPIPELVEKTAFDSDSRLLWLSTCAYISEEAWEWLPQFLGGVGILQPIVAQTKAQDWAEVLGGTPNFSRPPNADGPAQLDDILRVVDTHYGPAGQEESRWAGTDEFSQIAEQWSRSDICFGTAQPGGLTLETPFGKDSALIRLRTNERHPWLGSGLLAIVRIPYFPGLGRTPQDAAFLNFHEHIAFTTFASMGSWTPVHGRTPNSEGLACSTFVPNFLYRPGIATNVALWAVARARWVRKTLWADKVDLPISTILKERHKH